MNRQDIAKGVKEKGPAFFVGALLGATLVVAVVHREKIARTINTALKKTKEG